jgi:polysaccharide pyruvyl transferase WcaK-like protein
MKAAARAAHYRSYRDTISKTFMESIGFDTRNDPVYPDIAFRLPAPLSARRQETAYRAITVGVGVMAYHGWRNDDSARGAAIYADYLGKMTTFVCWLLDRGYLVRILMGDEADRPTVDDLFRAVRSTRPDRAEDAIVFAPAHTLQDVMQQMAGTDVVVATRYHNIVCALRVGKPTISIGYAGKNDALLAEVGLAEFCQHIERLDVELLKSQTAQLVSDRAAFEQRICDAQMRFESRLSEQEDLLASLIYSSSS